MNKLLPRVGLLLALCILGGLTASPVRARPHAAGWSQAEPELRARVAAGAPLVIHVTVALCHNEQIACGGGGLGNPGKPASNLYWGAIFGAKTIFDKARLGWTPVPQREAVDGVLERAVYRRWVDGRRWGRAGKVEQLVVLDAIHGAAIDGAVDGFFRRATEGDQLTVDDGDERRRVRVAVAGYAGHNRLMDGKKLPAARPAKKAVPSFVLACISGRFFQPALEEAGSAALVTTTAFMAPEGYVVEAMARALGDDRPAAGLRAAVVAAYAKWQRIDTKTAGRLFTLTPTGQRAPTKR